MASPQQAYRWLNTYLWRGRLPTATVTLVSDETIPCLHGITLDDDCFQKPIILLNRESPWGLTLIHEMVHIAEPNLSHGQIFTALTRIYWTSAKKKYPKLGAL